MWARLHRHEQREGARHAHVPRAHRPVVADPAAAVTDTHPLIFHVAGGRKLGKKAASHFAACERREALLYVPLVVLWELALLVRIGRIMLDDSLRGFCSTLFSNPAYQPLELTSEQVYLAHEERPNDDPFDALVCAAARSEGLPLITRDGDIQDSGLVKVLW
jgi:PIN domain nuclease of toxin-antitoxin system